MHSARRNGRQFHNQNERLVIAGTSAGAMAMSTPMIYAGVGRDEMIAGNVKVTMGLGFLKDVCVDTHFVDRGRFVRMAQVIVTTPSSIGVGIEENSAVVVRNGVEAGVIGSGVVINIDARNSHGSNVVNFNDDNLLSIRGLQVHILSHGEKYTIPQTGRKGLDGQESIGLGMWIVKLFTEAQGAPYGLKVRKTLERRFLSNYRLER